MPAFVTKQGSHNNTSPQEFTVTHPFSVSASSLSKTYRIYNNPRDRLLAGLPYFRTRKKRYKTFTALEDISFTLERGKTLGVVGKNGAGKSTLLQLLCGTLTPSSGSVDIDGRVGALLELGSGFNPEFTGLENIYFNSSILGLNRKETDERLDRILGFADIGEFIYQPVKTYSSGMTVRLAFSVQASCDPQVLIVDEALAVGDELFQKKCYSHLEGLKEKGTSIILVTHSCPQINQQCDDAILLHKGRCILQDSPQKVTALYQQLMNQPDKAWDEAVSSYRERKNNQESKEWEDSKISSNQTDLKIEGSSPWLDENLRSISTVVYPEHGGKILSIQILTNECQEVNVIPESTEFILRFRYYFEKGFSESAFTCYITSQTGNHITGQSLPEREGRGIPVDAGEGYFIDFRFEGRLWPGTYFIGGGIASPECEHRFIHRVVDMKILKVISNETPRIHGSCKMDAMPPEICRI